MLQRARTFSMYVNGYGHVHLNFCVALVNSFYDNQSLTES